MVGQMTSTAVLWLLYIMGIGCRLPMTSGTGHLTVRKTLVRDLIDQGDEFFCKSLCSGPFLSVTVEAEIIDPFDLIRIFFRHGTVTDHARGIFLRKGRKGIAGIVTGAALIHNGLFRIKPSAVRIADAGLIMGIVAS